MQRIFIVLFCVLMLCFAAKGSDACKCQEQTPKEAFKGSDCVFTGKVIRHELEDSATEITERYYFEVDKIWKGAKKKQIAVVTSPKSSCAYPFYDGQAYLVYARMSRYRIDIDSARLTTGLCSRTAFLAAAAEDLKELGEGQIIK